MPPIAARLGPHHDGSSLYVGDSTPRLGDRVPVRVRVPSGSGVDAVRIRAIRDAEPTLVQAKRDGGDDHEDWFTADVEVHNPDTRYRIQLDRGLQGYSWLNGTGEHYRDIPDAHDFRLTTHDPGPDWARDAVVYQVFPDRFARSGASRELPGWAVPAEWDDAVIHQGSQTPLQFFGGDLDGIRNKLSHLKSVGVTALYLTPIFPGGSNHRYNASSFAEVDPLLGGDAALARLARACHESGLHIVGDLTTNHSGDDHPWFELAKQGPDALERSFYYMDKNGDYISWLGVPSLPKFDLASQELRDRMFGTGDSVVSRWLRPPFDLDGWRIDVANMTGRQGEYDHGREVARLIRRTLDEVRPDSVLIAEYTSDFTADLDGAGWQGSMNYAGFAGPVWSWLQSAAHEKSVQGNPNRTARRSGQSTVATMREFAAAVPWKVAARHWNLASSHDTARIRTIAGTPEMVRVAAGLLFTYLGTPMVFAGDEIGLEGTNGEDSRRTMPWDRPEDWDQETLAVYRDLIAVRHAHPALRRGGLRWVVQTDDAIGYLRETADERILVVVARSRWQGALLPGGLVYQSAETLYGEVSLVVDGSGVLIPGEGPGVGIWRLT
ncbi:glycoside hydrolase family 13 protein [Nakamurella antarctica]|uniref:Glycoside hydrolase family 13 protein n=1 Tax=Nakamurella antarctica TaxID=1902245 RepID=A0A3G8ZPV7_9ACTN|nr:glycoside hydrolase family 13 protein [Nakamurella antarctica]